MMDQYLEALWDEDDEDDEDGYYDNVSFKNNERQKTIPTTNLQASL